MCLVKWYNRLYTRTIGIFTGISTRFGGYAFCELFAGRCGFTTNRTANHTSGTAKLLLQAMDSNHQYQEVDGRSGFVGKRGKEIGVHAIRGGSIAGEHTVMYLGDDEKLEIKHTAISRQIFVNGAVHAAKWLVQQACGFYNMQNMVEGGR